MPIAGLSQGLGIGGGTSATSSGVAGGGGAAVDLVILTEADDYMTTEDGFFLEFEL
jgi:hypothetical protein|tara:strand:+ start:145 stop:312 length:168 start_codon:yes stop_codon:yes gene_type:complete